MRSYKFFVRDSFEMSNAMSKEDEEFAKDTGNLVRTLGGQMVARTEAER